MKALSLLFACCALLFVAGTAHAEQIPDAELEVQIRRILQEHPDIVLDILREHSETALDIVQLGADRRRSEALRSQWTEDAKTPKKATLEEALTERKFGKIYIMLGINELGRGTTESFFNVYADAVNRIRMLQPDAVIFIQGIMRVGEEKNNTDAIFNNTNINGRNQAISLMADNQTIFYLEVNDVVCDENGNLISDYTFDQIHLKAKYYQLWKDYLFAHGIVRD